MARSNPKKKQKDEASSKDETSSEEEALSEHAELQIKLKKQEQIINALQSKDYQRIVVIRKLQERIYEFENANDTVEMRKVKGELQTCKNTLSKMEFKLMKRNEDVRKLKDKLMLNEQRNVNAQNPRNAKVQMPMTAIDALRAELETKGIQKRCNDAVTAKFEKMKQEMLQKSKEVEILKMQIMAQQNQGGDQRSIFKVSNADRELNGKQNEMESKQSEEEHHNEEYQVKIDKLKQDITRKSEEVESLKKQLVTQQNQHEYQRSIFQTKISEQNQALSALDIKLEATTKITDQQVKMMQETDRIIIKMKKQLAELPQFQCDQVKKATTDRDLETNDGKNQLEMLFDQMIADRTELLQVLSLKELRCNEAEWKYNDKKVECTRLLTEKKDYDVAIHSKKKDIEKQMAINSKLEKQNEKMSRKIEKLQDSVQSLRETKQEMKQKMKQEMKQEMTSKNNELKKLRNQFESLRRQKEKKINEMLEKEEREKTRREKQRKKYEDKIFKLKEKLAASNATLKGVRKAANKDDAMLQSKIHELKEKEEMINQLIKSHDEINAVIHGKTDAITHHKEIQTDWERGQLEIEKLIAEQTKLQQTLSINEREIKKREKALHQRNADYDQLMADKEDLENAVRAERERMELHINQKQTELDEIAIERNDLRQTIEEMEDEQMYTTTALRCGWEDSERKLQRAYQDIEELESQKKEISIEKHRTDRMVSRYVAKINKLEATLNIEKFEIQRQAALDKELLTCEMHNWRDQFIANQASPRPTTNHNFNSNTLDDRVTVLERALEQERERAERMRMTAIALKNLSTNLPSACINDIHWVPSIYAIKQEKPSSEHAVSVYAVQRSEGLQEYKNMIPSKNENEESVVTNNPINANDAYEDDEMELFRSYVARNGCRNMNPLLEFRNPFQCLPVNAFIGIRDITECEHLPSLIGEKECFAKEWINQDIVLGQFFGVEMLYKEFFNIYNMTKEEKEHLQFCHGERLQLPNGEIIDIRIDPIAFAEDKSSLSPLCFINDGRVNLKVDATLEDKERINTRFVSVLCDGWPMILVQTTKRIEAGNPLWIDYGPYYKNVLEAMECIDDHRRKAERTIDLMCRNVDLEEQRPLDLSHSSDDEGDSVKGNESDYKRQRPSHFQESPSKRRRKA